MDSVIKAFCLIKVDFSAMTIPVRSAQIWSVPGVQRASSLAHKGHTDTKRWVFSRGKVWTPDGNLLANLTVKRPHSAEKTLTSVSAWSCSGGWGKDKIPPNTLSKHLLCSPPGSPGRHLPGGRSSGIRNDISHQAGEDGVTRANLLLSDQPCHRLKHSCLVKDVPSPQRSVC